MSRSARDCRPTLCVTTKQAGLIAPVGRTSGNHRSSSADDLDWIAFLQRLRETGMAQLALVWALRNPRMASLVIGASSVST